MIKRLLFLSGLIVLVAALLPGVASAAGCDPANIIFSEIDYDQSGADHDEFIELFFPNAVTVSDCEMHLVNGANTEKYATIDVAGAYTAKQYVAFFHSGIQNGAPDGFALIDTTGGGATVVWFYSYEGTITGYDPASGKPGGTADSTELPVSDSGDGSIINGPAAGVGDSTVTTNITPNAANLDSTGGPNAITLSTLTATHPDTTILALSLLAILTLGAGAFLFRRRAV